MTGAKEELLSQGGVIGSWEKDVQKLVSVSRAVATHHEIQWLTWR